MHRSPVPDSNEDLLTLQSYNHTTLCAPCMVCFLPTLNLRQATTCRPKSDQQTGQSVQSGDGHRPAQSYPAFSVSCVLPDLWRFATLCRYRVARHIADGGVATLAFDSSVSTVPPFVVFSAPSAASASCCCHCASVSGVRSRDETSKARSQPRGFSIATKSTHLRPQCRIGMVQINI
jgi:hypothetical protein